MEFQASHPSSDSFAPRLAPVSHEAQLRDHRSLLHRLYVTENKPMKAVMDYMETHYQLRVGASTYSRIFREMNIRKNAKGDHWAYVDDRIRKRQSQGKESLVYAQGRLVEPKKVKKEIARHVTTLQQIASATGPGPKSPDGWSVETPGNESDAVMESLEDEAPDTEHPGCRTEVASPLRLQLQASRDFYYTLPTPGDFDGSVMELPPRPSRTSYDAQLAPTHEATLDDQVGYLAERLRAFKAFRTLSYLEPFHDWNRVYHRIMARNIVSVLRRQVLGPRYSLHHSFTEAIQITVCTMKNDPDLLRATFASANEFLERRELDDVLDTALYLAATYRLADAARTLIDLGADPNVRDFYGKTCRDIARDQNHREIVALLEQHDAGEGARRAFRTGVAENKATGPDLKMELGTDIEKPGRAVDIPKKNSAGSGPYGFNKWFDSVVMPWAQRNWDSLESSFSVGSFRVKLHSRPTSK